MYACEFCGSELTIIYNVVPYGATQATEMIGECTNPNCCEPFYKQDEDDE